MFVSTSEQALTGGVPETCVFFRFYEIITGPKRYGAKRCVRNGPAPSIGRARFVNGHNHSFVDDTQPGKRPVISCNMFIATSLDRFQVCQLWLARAHRHMPNIVKQFQHRRRELHMCMKRQNDGNIKNTWWWEIPDRNHRHPTHMLASARYPRWHILIETKIT